MLFPNKVTFWGPWCMWILVEKTINPLHWQNTLGPSCWGKGLGEVVGWSGAQLTVQLKAHIGSLLNMRASMVGGIRQYQRGPTEEGRTEDPAMTHADFAVCSGAQSKVVIIPISLILGQDAGFHKLHLICHRNILRISVQLMHNSLPNGSWGITWVLFLI